MPYRVVFTNMCFDFVAVHSNAHTPNCLIRSRTRAPVVVASTCCRICARATSNTIARGCQARSVSVSRDENNKKHSRSGEHVLTASQSAGICVCTCPNIHKHDGGCVRMAAHSTNKREKGVCVVLCTRHVCELEFQRTINPITEVWSVLFVSPRECCA